MGLQGDTVGGKAFFADRLSDMFPLFHMGPLPPAEGPGGGAARTALGPRRRRRVARGGGGRGGIDWGGDTSGYYTKP